MGLPKGRTNNPHGRAKGTENKVTAISKNLISDIINHFSSTIIEDIEKMEPVDRLNLLIKLLPFIIPKKSSLAMNFDETSKSHIRGLFPFAPPQK